jgi:deoxyribonuclease-2
MFVETWIRGDELPPACPPTYEYNVTNVESVTIAGTSWTETQDHSKWGVAASHHYVACIGDINRMSSQESRGGGALCVNEQGLQKGMLAAVQSHDSCSSSLRGSRSL